MTEKFIAHNSSISLLPLNSFPLNFQLDEFVNKFELEGPGMVQDMDKGQKLMETFGAEYEKMEATRVEMGNEILLILPRL